MTWLPSRTGREIELVAPRVDQVDFAELAHALSHLNRFAGHAMQPVSVGLHTIIACDAAPDPLKGLVLLHDAHETRTSEITAPTKEALRAVATELLGEQGAYTVDRVREELERRHDEIIYQAAGLSVPDEAQRRLIRQADMVALATERRDFCLRKSSGRPWLIDAENVLPRARVYRWRPPDVVADQLLELFNRWLPALRREPARRFG